MRKLKHSEVEYLAQGHRATKYLSWDSIPGSLAQEPRCFILDQAFPSSWEVPQLSLSHIPQEKPEHPCKLPRKPDRFTHDTTSLPGTWVRAGESLLIPSSLPPKPTKAWQPYLPDYS